MTNEQIHKLATDAANAAAAACTPTPMMVGTPATPWGNSIDRTKPAYYVSEGPCGFAWVKMGGNTSYGRWAKKAGLASKAYGWGVSISPSISTQSAERNEAWARAYAQVLRQHGIECYVDSRLD